MRHQRAMRPALLASIFLHLTVVAAARLPREHAGGAPVTPPESEPVDLWAGETPALPGDAARTVPVEVDERGAAAPVAPALAPKTTAETKAPADAPRPAAPVPRTSREPANGQTITTTARGTERGQTKASAAQERARAARSAKTQHGGDHGASSASSTGEDGADGAQGNFGAAGNTAVRSLGRAFTRAIPPACQADPAWGSLPAGDAGKARFVIEIDDAGHIASWKPEGEEPPARHLGNLAKRTIALLGSGTFAVARGAVTAGRQTLEIGAIVSDGAADSDPGSRTALAFRFADGRGEASFTEPGGRHVEVTLRVLHTEVVAATEPPG